MVFARTKNLFARRSSRIVAAVAMGASLIAAAPQAAQAATSPSVANLLSACAWADYCEFHPQSYWTYIGPGHQIGTMAYNCGSVTNSQAISWSDTTQEADSVGVTIGAKQSFFDKTFELSVQASYSHTWTRSHTDTQTDTVNIPSKHAGWLMRGTSKQEATGWFELHFNNPYYGHYVWYVLNYAESGFDVDNSTAGYVAFHDRPMTAYERQRNGC